MKAPRLAAMLLLCAAPAGAQLVGSYGLPSLKAADGVPPLGPGTLQAPADPAARLAATLADAGVPLPAKAAALGALSSEGMLAVDAARPSFSPSEEGVLVASLRAVADGAGSDDGLRLRAVRVLGAFARGLRQPAQVDAAVDYLASQAQAADGGLRRAGLYALAQAAEAVPPGDRAAAARTLNAAFDALRASTDGAEKQLAMTLVAQDAARNGASSYDADPALMQRLRGELLAPLSARVGSLYDDAAMNPAARLALYSTLYRLARSLSLDPSLRFEAAQVLSSAAQSRREPDPQLQAVLDLYAGRGAVR